MIAGTSFREFICECMKFCKQTLHLNVKNLSEEWTYMSPTGGSLVELAYEGVSSKFSCFLILPRTNKALLVTSPHCAKKNNNGTLFKLLAGTCWRHLVNGAKRETILSEKGLNSLIKHEPLQYLTFSVSGALQWTCSCPCTLHFKL